MNYLNVTTEELLRDFKTRLNSDPRFKNIGSATIYGMFMEMIAAVADMTNFYTQRTAEEAFITTARLDSSVIKHAKGLGYNPRRPVPARCQLIIRLKGPLPATIKAGTEVFFNQETTDLTYNGNKYILDSGYSYVFTEQDIVNGQSSDWLKELYFSVPSEKAEYLPLQGMSIYSTNVTTPISCFQGERKINEIIGTANIEKIGEPNQWYDIDDLEFSNWYGRRDPFGFRNNYFYPSLSWCQVGIGADEYDAFREENLYEIECQSIYLNDKIVNIPMDTKLDKPYKICLIDTNSDKTVRVSFSSEPNICDIGLRSYKDNIYVKYIATKGKSANQTGVKGAIMQHNNNIKVNIEGSLIDITNNVQFIINSDIYGGEDFESQESIKINAPAYFSSVGGKLVTKDDYTSYFRGLTSPITVQNALVFGQQEMEANNIYHKLTMNNIFYCIMGHLYAKNNGNWTPKNVLTDVDTNVDSFSIYGDEYLNHVCDYIKMLKSYNGYYNKIFKYEAEEQWLKNVRLIYENCKHKQEINSILMPLPPIVQYYDIVGTVYVDPLTDVEKYTNEMKNIVYEYLDKKAPKDRKIYKSEIINLYNKHDHTKAVDIDIKISDIVQSTNMKYEWSGLYNPNFRLVQNSNLKTYTDGLARAEEEITEGTSVNTKFAKLFGGGWWNELVISNTDQNGNILNGNMFSGKTITLDLKCLDCNVNNYTFTESSSSTRMKFEYSVDEATNEIHLYPPAVQKEGNWSNYRNDTELPNYHPNTTSWVANESGVIEMALYVPVESDYYSTSNLSSLNAMDYKLPGTAVDEIIGLLGEWLNNLSTIEGADRPIPLPYTVTSSDVPTRTETIVRRGNIIADHPITLSEYSFWNYFVPMILDTYYSSGSSKISETTEYDSDTWQAATKLIMDLYAYVKPGICDSILDMNNNIVNFSTDMEMPILVNKVTVKYRSE